MLIGDWIDNVFGYNQLPEEDDRPSSCNIFVKSSYEQKTNLKNKLNKYMSPNYTKKKLTPSIILKTFADKINMIICLGQTPYQLFNEKHPKKNDEDKKDGRKSKKSSKKLVTENNMFEEGDFDDIQIFVNYYVKPIQTCLKLEAEGLYFEINPLINKFFILTKKRELLVMDSNLYDPNGASLYNIFQEQKIELPHIKYFEKISNEYISDYYIYKQKYCFSSFIKGSNDNKKYFYYFNKYVNELVEANPNEKGNKEKKEIKNNKFITCRYLDNTFKITIIPHDFKEALQRKKEKEKKSIYKEFSFLCEDFVTSCSAVSDDTFLVGLKNGKLIKGKVIETYNDNNIDDIKIKIIFEKYIQTHKGSINVIEIDYRLGVIITGGEDNYINIRKLYDFELLLPLKIKDKYIITMAKISPMNLLYVLCLKKKNKHSIIFGYTLSGIRFAKSDYGYFTNIDFTKSGNIVSLINKMDIGILSGSTLKKIIIRDHDDNDNDCKEFLRKQKKIEGALWMQYDYFIRKNNNTKCRIISFIAKDFSFNTINVDNIKYFE